MDVGRVTGKKATAFGELVDVSGVDFVRREPVDLRDVKIDLGIKTDTLFDLFVEDIALVLGKLFGKCAYDTILPVTAHRKDGE